MYEYLRDRQEVDGDPADFLKHVFVKERHERDEVHVEQRDVARRDDSRQVDRSVKETDDHQRERSDPLAPRIAARLLRRRACHRVRSNCSIVVQVNFSLPLNALPTVTRSMRAARAANMRRRRRPFTTVMMTIGNK